MTRTRELANCPPIPTPRQAFTKSVWTVNDGFVDSETVCTTRGHLRSRRRIRDGLGGTIDSPPGALYPGTTARFFDMSYYELVETGPGC